MDSRLSLSLRAAAMALPLVLSFPASAQSETEMPGMDMSRDDAKNTKDMKGMKDMPDKDMPDKDTPEKDMSGMDMPGMDMSKMAMPMLGALGPYAMSREASGTSWQPEATPDSGIQIPAGDWMVMAHGLLNAIYDNQGGPRGADKAFSSSMGMVMADRALGDADMLGLRAMLSLDPLMGKNGYPLLFATGETADGREPLVDRQHPHDLFMELSASFSHRLSDQSSIFIYAGLPGEPALGPPAFMHRTSGEDIPEAPITHHWLDSTHITYGVVTLGMTSSDWKLEGSVFKGREPDQYRYDIEGPDLDSVSTRLTWNPDPNWSLQASWGYLKSPEQLMPNVDENRVTASASYTLPFGDNLWSTTFAWGQKNNRPGRTLNGFLMESELTFHDTHTLFLRAERTDEDELFEPPSALAGNAYTVGKVSLGYIYDLKVAERTKIGIGGLVSRYAYPGALDPAYGSGPTSFMIFLRLKAG
jgi:hypothetical protein